jgi:hypothetical protein
MGAPQIPFPALVWNNRPFTNPLELLLVPQYRSSQLLSAYCPAAANYWSTFQLPATSGSTGMPSNVPYFNSVYNNNVAYGYGYLGNPFYTPASGGGQGTFLNTTAAQASPLVRLLDYVEVPSPFVSARTQLDPSSSDPNGYSNIANANSSPDFPFFVPFNWVSNYRDPGKINLNTIYSVQVWQGLTNYFPDVMNYLPPNPLGTTPPSSNILLWDKFVRSRRGFLNLSPTPFTNSTESDMLRMDLNYPTRFVNPFRGPAGAWLVPPVPSNAALPPATSNPNYLACAIGGEINTGLLRAELQEPQPPPTTQPLPPSSSPLVGTRPNRPLFQFDTSATGTTALYTATGWNVVPNGIVDATHPLNPDRNPCFRYQLIEKLSNTTTTRSNVYAIWITVGYFEVRPGTVTQFHPDGYYLGQELGSDTGDVHRHRAFYIFDRSAPMGFVRGMDLNFDKGVLIKRFIE